MPNLPPLPPRLKYLQPLRRKFSSPPTENLTEDYGTTLLIDLLTKHVHGLSLPEAEQLLAGDFAEVQSWLAGVPQQNELLPLSVLLSLMSSPADLAKRIKEEAAEPKLRLHMDPPAGAKVRRVGGPSEDGMIVKLKGVWLIISALPAQSVENAANATASEPGFDRLLSNFQLGAVTGRKLVKKRESWRGPAKEITYELTVPGGHVFATIAPLGKRVDSLNWSEQPFEACFHTLRVETYT
jgi:hypothetical protein